MIRIFKVKTMINRCRIIVLWGICNFTTYIFVLQIRKLLHYWTIGVYIETLFLYFYERFKLRISINILSELDVLPLYQMVVGDGVVRRQLTPNIGIRDKMTN